MQRVIVVGNAGSGKTTVGRALARRLGAPHVELDAIYHLPGWREIETPLFREIVAGHAAGEAWVIDGNYTKVFDLLLARTDTLVWLDLPQHVVMRQLLWRTGSRLVSRRPLWNGNREQWRFLLRRDPKENILLWGWTQHGMYRERYEALTADPAHAHLHVVRLRSRTEVEQLLAALG